MAQTTYSNVIQFSDNMISDSGVSKTTSAYVPAGLVEGAIIHLEGATAAEMCDGSPDNLFSNVNIRFAGTQVCNLIQNVTGATENSIGRLGATLESVGGYIAGDFSASAYDVQIFIPLGIVLTAQTRMEVDLTTVAGAVTPTSQNTEIILKYGNASAATVYANPSTFNLTTGQTLCQVPIGSWGKGAKVIGVAIQEPNNTDKITKVIAKPLGDFAATPSQLRARSGVLGGKQFYYPDPDTTGEYTFVNELGGFHWVNLYDLDVSGTGSITFLMTASESVNNVQFAPILKLPTSNGGEAKAMQTASVSSSGSDYSNARAEE
jgi:hypothetical protein